MISDAVHAGQVIIIGAVLTVVVLVWCALSVLAGVAYAVARTRARRARRDFDAETRRGLYAHLNDYVLNDPELAAGFNRPRDAIRNKQQNQKGDQ